MNTLVSFNVCPFVQRSLIVLEEKRVRDHYDIRYIDLDAKPDWFLRYAPMGQVPILIVGDTVLFESAAINEYIDDVSPGPGLHPLDPLRRAHNRAWIEFLSSVLILRNRMQHASAELETRELAARIHRQLQQLERQLGRGPFFNGQAFSLVDAAAAPLLQRLHWLLELAPDLAILDGLPRVQTWSDTLLAHPSVQRSAGVNLRIDYLNYLQHSHTRDGRDGAGWLGRRGIGKLPINTAA
ncbi:MAG: glutathione S-transferase family protein [Pseudomonadota bacterium]